MIDHCDNCHQLHHLCRCVERVAEAEKLLEKIRKETCYAPLLTDGTIQAVRDFIFKRVPAESPSTPIKAD